MHDSSLPNLLHQAPPLGWGCKTSWAAILSLRWPMSLLVPSRCKSILSSMILMCLVALLCSLVLPQRLTAQISTTGKIAGTVTDGSGAAVPNAAVSVKSTALLVPRNTHTEADSGYLFD